jgi:hypothetical protein
MINIKAASGTDLSHPTPKPNIKKGPKLALQIENKLAFLGVGVKGLLMALVVVGVVDSVIEVLQLGGDGEEFFADLLPFVLPLGQSINLACLLWHHLISSSPQGGGKHGALIDNPHSFYVFTIAGIFKGIQHCLRGGG